MELDNQKGRKRVAVDPNTKFANIDAIKKAKDEAAEQQARIEARESEVEAKARKAAEAIKRVNMQDLLL